jgi:aspartyl-tRNA(Asn)/glutamyl-tRNA(Gln) amidotransferase subunit B
MNKPADKYEVVIGIETHVQLATKSKLFCGCNNDSRDAVPNSHVCPVCLGLPGALPVLNEAAIKLAVHAGHALNAYPDLKEFASKFDRKNYFYPDSPMNYQITQFDQPIVGKGHVEFPVEGKTKRVGITRAHLEADAGKLIHPAGKEYSLVDLNRAGTPLLEIVSEPDMRSAAEAKSFAQEIYNLMRYAEVSDANLYYGNLRFDVNVSLRPIGSNDLGTRTESKNLNSFRAVAGVVEYETKRQSELLDKGEKIVQETRGWDETKNITFSQRTKEESHDYRYFPEPDLPPLVITEELLTKAKKAMPDFMPNDARDYLKSIDLKTDEVETLVGNIGHIAILRELRVKSGVKSQQRRVALWLINTEAAENQNIDPSDVASVTAKLGVLAGMVEDSRLSSTAAKEVFIEVIKTGADPEEIAKGRNLIQVSDSGELEKIVDEVIAANPTPVAEYRAGEQKVLGFLVGQVMKASKGQANPPMVNDILKQKLQEK